MPMVFTIIISPNFNLATAYLLDLSGLVFLSLQSYKGVFPYFSGCLRCRYPFHQPISLVFNSGELLICPFFNMLSNALFFLFVVILDNGTIRFAFVSVEFHFLFHLLGITFEN